jgi:hypothetical protein
MRSLSDDKNMPIRPRIDVERSTLLKHGRTLPFTRRNRSKLWKQVDTPLYACEQQDDTCPLAVIIEALLDLIHAVVRIWSSGEGRKELNEHQMLRDSQILGQR